MKTGLNTGVSSQILSGELKEGMMVVNGQVEITAGKDSKEQRSPFLPQPPKRRNRNQNRARGAR